MAGTPTKNKGKAPANGAKAPAKGGKKGDDKKVEELSEEDIQLRDQLNMLVERLKEPDTSLYKPALESLRTQIRTATSSMTSVPKPLKFLRLRYQELVEVHTKWEESEVKHFLADILSVLAMTSSTAGSRETLKYRFLGSAEPIGSWGHEYIRYLASEVIQEYSRRLESVPESTDHSDLLKLVDEIVPFCMSHNAEADACDLLMELEVIHQIVQFIDEKNFERVCLYLASCVNYVPEPEDHKILIATLDIYKKLNRYPEALLVSLRLNEPDRVQEVFNSCSDPLEKKQLAFILARQRVGFDSGDNDLNDIINNTRLTEHFIALARDLEVLDPKTPDDIYKSHLEPSRPGQSSVQPDSVRHNLASTFVNAFVNAGFGTDKLMTTEGSQWLYKNKEMGMLSAAASLGMIHMWDVTQGLVEIDKLMYSEDDHIKAGALLGVGLVSVGVRNECDPALALLSDHLSSNSVPIRTSAIAGLGLAYAGSNRQEVADLLTPIVLDTSLSVEISSLAGLSLGLTHVASCNGEVTGTFLQTLLERDPKTLSESFARFMALGLALVYLGKQDAAEATLEALKAVPEPISKQASVLLEIAAYAGTGNVLKIQNMLHYCTDHLDSTKENDVHQAFAVLGISLIAMGEEIGSEMALRSFNHLMHYGEPVIRRAVPLALALLCASNPQDVNLLDTLSKYSHDNDLEVAQSAIFSMGLVGAGTNNARLAQMLRHLASYYYKEPSCLFMIRIAQGLLHMGKGTLTVNPYHFNRQLVSPTGIAGLLTVLVALTDAKSTILGKHPYLLYFLSTAMQPRVLITLDENLKSLPVSVRVGQAVDTVGQAGRPKTITGFQTHTSPVLIGYGERAELATDEYVTLSRVLEGFVILKKNPNYRPPETEKKR